MILGIDPSGSKLAWVGVHELHPERILASGEEHLNPMAYAFSAREWAKSLSEMYTVTLVYVERPVRFYAVMTKINRVIGALMTVWPDLTVVSPSEWKYGIGLNGSASKDAVATRVLEVTGAMDGWSQDMLDASAIAYFAASRNLKDIERATA